MAFHVFDDQEQGALFAVIVVTIPICVLVTILRFLGTKRSTRKIGWEDWFALLALVFYLVYSCMMLWTVVSTNGVSVFELAKLPPALIVKVMKVGYAMNPQFSVSQTFAKLSLLVLYRRVFSFSPKAVACTYVLGAVQLMWFIAMFFIRWFMCTPVSKVWAPATPGTCINSQILLAAGEAVNSVIDFVMVGVAVFMVRTWMMSPSTKWKLSFLFALGGFSGVIGFIKIGEAYGQIGSNYINAIWNIVQMATSIICCCAPIYKTILPDSQVWNSIKSTFSSSGGRSQRSAGSSTGKSYHHKQETPDWLHPDGGSTSELGSEEPKTLTPQRTHGREEAARQPMSQGFDMV